MQKTTNSLRSYLTNLPQCSTEKLHQKIPLHECPFEPPSTCRSWPSVENFRCQLGGSAHHQVSSKARMLSVWRVNVEMDMNAAGLGFCLKLLDGKRYLPWLITATPQRLKRLLGILKNQISSKSEPSSRHNTAHWCHLQGLLWDEYNELFRVLLKMWKDKTHLLRGDSRTILITIFHRSAKCWFFLENERYCLRLWIKWGSGYNARKVAYRFFIHFGPIREIFWASRCQLLTY